MANRHEFYENKLTDLYNEFMETDRMLHNDDRLNVIENIKELCEKYIEDECNEEDFDATYEEE